MKFFMYRMKICNGLVLCVGIVFCILCVFVIYKFSDNWWQSYFVMFGCIVIRLTFSFTCLLIVFDNVDGYVFVNMVMCLLMWLCV